MNGSLDKTLLKAVKAQNSGNLQKAHSLYDAILDVHPEHPDANYNKGILVRSIGKVKEALPFFKIALKAKPSIPHFWISYIESLTHVGHLLAARSAFARVKALGAKGGALDVLEENLLKAEEAAFARTAQGQFELIKGAALINEVVVQAYSNILKMYFREGRPRSYIDYEELMTLRFPEVVEKIDFIHLTKFTHQYLQFCKTVNKENFSVSRQKYLSLKVLTPFLNQIKAFKKKNPLPKLTYRKNPNNILFVVLHATCGAYAPGKAIFSIVRALLSQGKTIKVISLGSIDNSFTSLMDDYPNLKVCKSEGSDDLKRFHGLRKELTEFKPQAIFTEREVSILVALELFQIPSPIYMYCGGFAVLPYFSKILLVPELQSFMSDANIRHNFHKIPQTHTKNDLAPRCDPSVLEELKAELQISNTFVIGSFASYHKFSMEFLLLARDLIESIPNSTLLLAGNNDEGVAETFFSDFIKKDRVRLLGLSNIGLLGYCCDVFLETFPICCGYSVLESMAKGKPVFSLDCNFLESYKVSRIQRLVFKSKKNLVASISKSASDRDFYNEISTESQEFIGDNFYDLELMSDALAPLIK